MAPLPGHAIGALTLLDTAPNRRNAPISARAGRGGWTWPPRPCTPPRFRQFRARLVQECGGRGQRDPQTPECAGFAP